MNNSFKSKIAKNLFLLSKTVSSHQKEKFHLAVHFKNPTGSTHMNCEFVNGEITNDMLPIHNLTDDCFDGNVVRGDDFKKMIETIEKYENTPSYYWDRTPDWGYLAFGRANNETKIFGVMLSEKGARLMEDNYCESIRKKNGWDSCCPFDYEIEYARNFLKKEIECEKNICKENYGSKHKEIIEEVRKLSFLLADEQTNDKDNKIIRLGMFAELLSKVNKMEDIDNINVFSFIKCKKHS